MGYLCRGHERTFSNYGEVYSGMCVINLTLTLWTLYFHLTLKNHKKFCNASGRDYRCNASINRDSECTELGRRDVSRRVGWACKGLSLMTFAKITDFFTPSSPCPHFHATSLSNFSYSVHFSIPPPSLECGRY